ncbi:hypothetical protein GCM10010330_51390 [Streptomyces tendae]|nr:hypothetical protein GCM10010330_51390 [Streptomyces tendae]
MNWATSSTARTTFDRPVSRCGSAAAPAVAAAVAVVVGGMAFPFETLMGLGFHYDLEGSTVESVKEPRFR